MSTANTAPGPTRTSALPTVRRLIVFTLLFALVAIAGNGLSGLLGRLLEAGDELVTGDVSGLAQSLAFTLIGGPLAAILWWIIWSRVGDERERSSLAWGLYVAGMSAASLITFSTALLVTASALVRGDWQPRDLSTGLVWAGVWMWHRWMWLDARRSPTRLAGVPPVVGSVLGLLIGIGGAVTALGTLLDTAIGGFDLQASVGDPWWRHTLEALVWTVGGAAIWWWHWVHDDARRLRSGLARVALIVVGVLGASALALGGAATILFVLLRLAFDRTDPTSRLVDPLSGAIAAAAIGSLVWGYHQRVALGRPDATRHAARLVVSGLALAATASGIGVIVNSLLATAGTPLAGSDTRTLLLGGISSLIVGGPLWWLVWRPTVPAQPAQLGSTGRRVFLVSVFGLSAVVALITLLVIGFRVFEFVLGEASGGGLIDRVRAPLGLLVATGLVAAYHFAVWRRDRSATAAAAPTPSERSIEHVILVTGSDPEPLRRVIDDVTGASVTVWMRSDVGGGGGFGGVGTGTGTDGTADIGTAVGTAGGLAGGSDAEQLARALRGITGDQVLVVMGPGHRVDVIPLA